MTTEEKAKAYDEALEKARKRVATEPQDHTDAILKDIFPELRESEDESLKNKSGYYKGGKFWKASTLWQAVKNKIPQRVPNRYILQDCTWNISSLRAFADEVKNVQEAELDYPIILDINGNILDGAHRVVKAYLQNKDIDVVYLGDDEWPEPDYDEEKAVKESDNERIRKALICGLSEGLSEHNWQDFGGATIDECLAYLEKQKEQNKCPEFCSGHCVGCEINEQKDYRKLYEDIAKSEWFKKAYEGKSLGGDDEQKEQKPTEWSEEDEEMLDLVIGDVTDAKKNFVSKDAKDCCDREIAWLKSLRPSWKPSEDEERLINTSISFLKDFADKGYENAVECIDWLKSLRPQPQHRDTYYDIIHSILAMLNGIDFMQITPEHRVSLLNDIRVRCKHADEWADILDEPQWKPSEEQMEALRKAVNKLADTEVADSVRLSIMYDHLKKLI